VGIIVETAPTIKHECDNSPTVSWIERMASKYIFPTAGRLLRGLAYMLHSCQAGEVITVHVKGVDNVMADLASQPSKAMAKFAPTNTHLSDVDFLSSFNTEFPLPNNQEWKLATVPEWLKFNVFETLRGKRLDLQQWASQSGAGTGKRGRGTVNSTTRAAVENLHPTQPTCSSPLLLPCGKVSTVLDVKSKFSQCQKLSEPSPKGTFWTDTPIKENPLQPSTTLTYDLPLAHLLKKYNDEDPPAQPKLAVPVSTVKKICKHYKFSDHHRAVANLCTIAFFYLTSRRIYNTNA
jgi:hypothetical protein